MFQITIYKITNTIDNLIYVGYSSQPLKIRFSKHRSRSKTYQNKLYRHCLFVGWDNVKIEAIRTSQVYSHEHARDLERYYIDLLRPDLNTNLI